MRMLPSILCLFASTTLLAEEGDLPLIFSDDFEQGADHWQPTDDEAWKVQETDKGRVYSQFKKRSDYNPPHRSPYNVALLEDVLVCAQTAYRWLSSCTASTREIALSTGVCCNTPCPKLKICPGRWAA